MLKKILVLIGLLIMFGACQIQQADAQTSTRNPPSLIKRDGSDGASLSRNLSIDGSLTVSEEIYITGTENRVSFADGSYIDGDDSGAGTLTFNGDSYFNNDVNVASDLTIDTNTLYVDSGANRVGIGTSSPGEAFSLNGTGNQLGLYNSGTREWVCNIGDDWAFFSDTSGGFPLYLDGNGNRVGINNFAPTETLDVNGNLTTSGGNFSIGDDLTSDGVNIYWRGTQLN